MPVPEDFPGNFRNPDSWTRGARQKAVIEEIETALMARDYCGAGNAVEELEPVPDYILIPAGLAPTGNAAIGAYGLDRHVESYALMKRIEEGGAPCPTK
jgi:hypothetical protein